MSALIYAWLLLMGAWIGIELTSVVWFVWVVMSDLRATRSKSTTGE